MPRAVALLEVMWDWEAMTSSAGYEEIAPPYFRINIDNFTGRRLYDWLGHRDLLVTNACPQLVNSASGKGTPNLEWVRANLNELWPMELLLVCGRVARETFFRVSQQIETHDVRVVCVPHPAARMWNRRLLARVRSIIRHGKQSVNIEVKNNQLRITRL